MPGELKQAKGNSYYYNGRLSVGVYVDKQDAILIDSGIDKGSAKEVIKALQKHKLNVKAIINTHFHADHCGGNHYFQTQYKNLAIYATEYEKPFIENSYMEPSCFCGGAEPLKDLSTNKLITTQNSTRVTHSISPYRDQVINVAGTELQVVTLPGHTPGMIGIRTPDNILYCGDAIFGHETYSKHSVLFYTNMKDTMATFDKLAKLDIAGCVYYHGGYAEGKLDQTVKIHREKIMSVMRFIYQEIQKQPHTLNDLTQRVMQEYKIPDAVVHFTLTQVCVNAYVACLENNNNLFMLVKEGRQLATHSSRGLTLPFGEPIEEPTKLLESKQETVAPAIKIEAFKKLTEYKLENLTSGEHKENDGSLKLAIYFHQNLEGDFHVDGFSLNEVETLINHIKASNLVQNQKTVVECADEFAAEYNRAELKEHKGSVAAGTPTSAMISVGRLFSDRVELNIDKVANVEQLSIALSKLLEQGGLTHKMSCVASCSL